MPTSQYRHLAKYDSHLHPLSLLTTQSKSFLNFIRNQTAEQLQHMGNSYRKYSPLTQLSLHLEYPYYTSGQMLRGLIIVRSVENLSTKVLYLRIEGQQRCLWYEGSSLNRRRMHGLNQFFNLQYAIHNFEKQPIPPSDLYKFAFCFDLSTNLQGTYQSYLNDKTYIRYKIKAQLIDYTYPDSSLYFQMPLEIRQPFRRTIQPIEGVVCTAPTGCFASGQGQTTLKMVLSKNVAYIGQFVDINIFLDNTANSQPVREVRISLVQSLFVNANNGVTRTFKTTKRAMSGAGAVGGGVSSYKVPFQITHQDIDDPSAIGTIVANYYTFEAEAVVGIRKYTKNCPYLSAPIYIMTDSPNSIYGEYPPPQLPSVVGGNKGFSIIGNPLRNQKIQIFDVNNIVFSQNQQLQVVNYDLNSAV